MTSTQRSSPERAEPRGPGKINHFDIYSLDTDATAVYSKSSAVFVSTVDKWDVVKMLNLFYASTELANEAGEVLGEVKKILRDDLGRVTQTRLATLKHELGDTLYGLARVCRELGISLGEVAEENLTMLKGRAERGTLHGSGNER